MLAVSRVMRHGRSAPSATSAGRAGQGGSAPRAVGPLQLRTEGGRTGLLIYPVTWQAHARRRTATPRQAAPLELFSALPHERAGVYGALDLGAQVLEGAERRRDQLGRSRLAATEPLAHELADDRLRPEVPPARSASSASGRRRPFDDQQTEIAQLGAGVNPREVQKHCAPSSSATSQPARSATARTSSCPFSAVSAISSRFQAASHCSGVWPVCSRNCSRGTRTSPVGV